MVDQTPRDFREEGANLSPIWLRFINGERFIGVHSLMFDVLAEGAQQAVLVRNLRYRDLPADAIPRIGASRLLPQYPAESDAAYQDRIGDAWEDWPQAGTDLGMIGRFADFGVTAIIKEHREQGAGRDFAVDDVFTYASIQDINDGNPWSVSFWVNVDIITGSNNDNVLLIENAAGSTRILVGFTASGGIGLQIIRATSPVIRVTGAPDVISTNTLHHVVVAGDGSLTAANWNIWIDGVPAATFAVSTNGVGGVVAADGEWNICSQDFDGEIWAIGVWDTELVQADVDQLFTDKIHPANVQAADLLFSTDFKTRRNLVGTQARPTTTVGTTLSLPIGVYDWDFDNEPTNWSRHWPVITSHPWIAWEWGDGYQWGGGRTWGSTASREEIDSLKQISAQWKPMEAVTHSIIIVVDAANYQGAPAANWHLSRNRDIGAAYVRVIK